MLVYIIALSFKDIFQGSMWSNMGQMPGNVEPSDVKINIILLHYCTRPYIRSWIAMLVKYLSTSTLVMLVCLYASPQMKGAKIGLD